MTLSQWRGRKIALIFLSPRCKHSEKLLPDLAALLSEGAEVDPAPVIISTGSVEENQRFFGEHHIACPILLQEDSEVAALYQAMATPMAYLVDENGATLGNAAVGPTAILRLSPRSRPGGGSHFQRPYASGDSQRSLAFSQINRDGLKAGTPGSGVHAAGVRRKRNLAEFFPRHGRCCWCFRIPTASLAMSSCPNWRRFTGSPRIFRC